MRPCYVYILANRRYGVLYVGMTNNLARRTFEHQKRLIPGFTSNYGVTRLVYVEEYPTALEARARERSLKRWRRDWKLKLIDEFNPKGHDLAEEITA
jgi:putative endonuclease